MTTTSTAVKSSSDQATSAFWERFWRLSGIQFVALFIIASVIYGFQPPVGASNEILADFFGGHRTWILIATVIAGVNLLNLMWFAAALRTTLADAGQEGWGTAATAASAAFAALFFLEIALNAALTHSLAGNALVSALNEFSWAVHVLSSFPRAMLIMSGVFGLWRAGLISDTLFKAGVVIVILGVLGGTTWFSNGVWAPDGVYSRFVGSILLLIWVLAVSRVLLTRSVHSQTGW